MTALEQLQAAGLVVSVAKDQIRLAGLATLAPHKRDQLIALARTHKAEIISELTNKALYQSQGPPEIVQPRGDLEGDFYDQRLQEVIRELSHAEVHLGWLSAEIRHQTLLLEGQIQQAAEADDQERFEKSLDSWKETLINASREA